MTSNPRARHIWAATVLLAVFAVAATSSFAAAAPNPAKKTPLRVRTTLETSSTSLSTAGTAGISVSMNSNRVLSGLRVRFQVFAPDGSLVLQKTVTEQSAGPGKFRVSYAHALSGLSLKPGAYPVLVTVHVPGIAQPRLLSTTLYVSTGRTSHVPVVLVARVTGVPMRDPSGRFVDDPATDTGAIDDASAAAALVNANPAVRLSLAVPPILLEEWKRVSLGYDLVTPTGVTHVPPTDPTPQHYAAALDAITTATASGRLELLAIGYSDPDPSSLQRAGLLGDLGTQFRAGLSATFASLGTSPSAGAMFAGGCLPAAGIPALLARGTRYAVLSGTCVRAGKSPAPTGVYPVAATSFKAFVADKAASARLTSGEASPAVGGVFALAAAGTTRPFVAVADVGPGRAGAAGLQHAVDQLLGYPWARLVTPAQALAKAGKRSVIVSGHSQSDRAPAGYWEEVVSARNLSRSLVAAAGEDDVDAQSANTNSLVAEDSSWAGPDRSWALADRGRAFSADAERTVKSVFDKVRVSAADLTLSGTRGNVPVTVHNGTAKTLHVTLDATSTGEQVKLPGPESVVLRPSDNYFTLPVDLRSAISAKLVVAVWAGGTVVASDKVTVRASYLDRLAIVGGIVALLAGLLGFIVYRVRRAETLDPQRVAELEGSYTDLEGREPGSQDDSEDS